MKLKDFITNYIETNSIIRLWYKNEDSSHTEITDKPLMEWELLNSKYADIEVLNITDIFNRSYPEAINIVLKSETINSITSNIIITSDTIITTSTVTNAKPQCYSDNFNTYYLDKDGNYIKQ
jgi:hypothetical protein